MDKFYPLLIFFILIHHTCQSEIPLKDEETSQDGRKIGPKENIFQNSSIISRRAMLHNGKLRRLGLPKYSEAVVLAGMREVKNSFNSSNSEELSLPEPTIKIRKSRRRNSTEEATMGGEKSASFQQQIFIEHPMNPKYQNSPNELPSSPTHNELNYQPVSYTQNDLNYHPILNTENDQPVLNFQNQLNHQPRSNLVFPQPLNAPNLEEQSQSPAYTTSNYPKKSIFPKEQQYQSPVEESQYIQSKEQQYQQQVEQYQQHVEQQSKKPKHQQFHREKKPNYQQQHQKEQQEYQQPKEQLYQLQQKEQQYQQPKVQQYQQQSNPTGSDLKGPIIINYEEPIWGRNNPKQTNFQSNFQYQSFPPKLSQEMTAARVNIAPNFQTVSTGPGSQFTFPSQTQGRSAASQFSFPQSQTQGQSTSAETPPPTLYRYIPAQPPLPPQSQSQSQPSGILFPADNQVQPGNPSIPQFRFSRQQSGTPVTPAPLPHPQGTVSPNSQPFRFNYNPVSPPSQGSGSAISFPQNYIVGPTQAPFQYNNFNTQGRSAGSVISGFSNVQGQGPIQGGNQPIRFFPQPRPISIPQSAPYTVNVFHQSAGQRSPGTPQPVFINQNQNQGFQQDSPPLKYSTIFPRPNSIQDSTAAKQPFPAQFVQARTANSNFAVTTLPSVPQSQLQFHRESSTYPLFPTGNFNFPQQGIPIRGNFQQFPQQSQFPTPFNRNYPNPMNPAPAPQQFQGSAADLGPYRYNNANAVGNGNFQTQQLNQGGQIRFTTTSTPKPNGTTPFKLEIEFPPFIPASLEGYIPSKTGANYTMPDLKTEVINYPVEYKETMLHHQYYPNMQNPTNQVQYQPQPQPQVNIQRQPLYQENPPQSNNLYQQYPLSQAMGLRNPKQLRSKTITKRRPKEDYEKMSTPITYNLTYDANGNSSKEEAQVSSGTFQVLSRIFGFGSTTTTTTPAPLRSLDIVDIRHIFFTPEPLQLTESGSRSAALLATREKSKTSKRKSKGSKKRTTTTASNDDTEEDQEELASLDSPAESQQSDGETTKEPEVVEIMKETKSEDKETIEVETPKKEQKKKLVKKEKTSKEIVEEIDEPEVVKTTKTPPCKHSKESNSEEVKASPRPAPGTPEVQLRILWPDTEEASGNTVTPFKTITPQQVLQKSIWPQTGDTIRPQEGLVTNIWPYNEQALRHEVPFHSESQGRNVESTLNHYRALMSQLVTTQAPTTVQTTTEDGSVAKSVGRFAGGVVRNVSNMVNFLSG